MSGREGLHGEAQPFVLARFGGSFFVLQLGDRTLTVFACLVANDLHLDALADGGAGDEQRQFGGVFDRVAVELDDDVADLDARFAVPGRP